MQEVSDIKHIYPWINGSDDTYVRWRADKVDKLSSLLKKPPVGIKNLANPDESERATLLERCRIANMAIYAAKTPFGDAPATRRALLSFTKAMGLHIAERHRSADNDGIVALRVTRSAKQRGFIPYSRKPMNWHSDGYYNAADNLIRAMILHCEQPADDGGQNQFFDQEVAYMRLRDENPDFIAALSHPQAMTIPAHDEPGSERPASIGPVFSTDAETGRLLMRYTARTRSISWRDDALTKQAVTSLQKILGSDDPLMHTVTLTAGQGILCNNVLHNRTGFDKAGPEASQRLVYRMRFNNRLTTGEQINGQA